MIIISKINKKHPTYIAYSDGRVFSLKTKRFLNPEKRKDGYHMLVLSENKVLYRTYIHRFIAMTFYPDADFSLEVNHIDGNKSNNAIDNLEWVTKRENQIHAFKLGLKVSKKLGNHQKARKVVRISPADFTDIKIYSCITSVIKDGFKEEGVIQCAKGRKKRGVYRGYKWMYFEDWFSK